MLTIRFKGKLEPVPHGGLFVVVPAQVAAKAKLVHGARVRGTVNGARYRSSLMKYSGVFHLGIHKATASAAGVSRGAVVSVTIEHDAESLPTDVVPGDLATALNRVSKARTSWGKLAPSVRRGYVKSVLEAKKQETRARRIATIVATLRGGVPPRRTWQPGSEETMTSKSPPKKATKVKPGASKAKPIKVRKGEKAIVLLSGGNPRIAKAEGDAPVQAYVAAMPGWKRDVGKRLDALIVRNVRGVRKAVKWNSPFYGIEGRGWFLSFHVFTHYVKVTFFRGASLRTVPPGGTGKDARWIDIHEDDLDEEQMATWIKQAAALPGWSP